MVESGAVHDRMNLSLIDPFVLAQDYPDTLTEKLSMFFCCWLCWGGCVLTLCRERPCDVFAV